MTDYVKNRVTGVVYEVVATHDPNWIWIKDYAGMLHSAQTGGIFEPHDPDPEVGETWETTDGDVVVLGEAETGVLVLPAAVTEGDTVRTVDRASLRRSKAVLGRRATPDPVPDADPVADPADMDPTPEPVEPTVVLPRKQPPEPKGGRRG